MVLFIRDTLDLSRMKQTMNKMDEVYAVVLHDQSLRWRRGYR